MQKRSVRTSPHHDLASQPERAGRRDQHAVALHQAVDALPVAAEDRAGDDRSVSFGGWIDADRDGCTIRQEVPLEEATEAPDITGRCTLTPGTGTWWSW